LIDLFVPGRLCLFGEHSDWAGGYRRSHPEIAPGRCLVAGTDQGLRASAAPLDGALEITSVLPDGSRAGPERIGLEALERVAAGTGFFSYAAATLAELRDHHRVGGLQLTVESDLPVRKGLSSSAAICVLVARAASRLYRLGLSTEAEMAVAYAGERRTGSQCGRMDQVCAFGRGPVAMHIDGDTISFDELRPRRILYLLIVDLCRSKDTRRILADLNACFPAGGSAGATGVREALGPRNLATLAEAEALLTAGDARGLGELMSRAQAHFDEWVAPASPALGAPRLHELLAHPAVAELGWGGKGVGSQGDGCGQIVTRGADERRTLAARLEADLGVRCLSLTLGGGDRPESGRD